jgi:2-iminobutanoate/2-iminopropanoate deaminase
VDIKRWEKIDGTPVTGGPYATAVRHGGLLFLAGQIPWNVSSQTLFQGSVTAEVQNIFSNVRRVLEHCASSLDVVLRVNAYLLNPEDAKEFSAAYEAHFKPDCLPVRTLVFVKALPLGARMEMEFTAAAE